MPFLGNIGGGELLVIGVIALLLLGGKRLNDVARGLGESTKEVKKIQKEFHSAVNEDINDIELPEKKSDTQNNKTSEESSQTERR